MRKIMLVAVLSAFSTAIVFAQQKFNGLMLTSEIFIVFPMQRPGL